ncbi:MAG: chemotaxis protein CheB [Acidobacteriota bacterium]|nr:chemotaxis protein CheB [Acidobacteriota bacterium]
MSLKPVRVLVVDDSLTVRGKIVESLEGSPGFSVVGEAADGRMAFDLCQRLRPDVVTLDMVMDGVGGLEATRRIMANCPTPILIISASAERGELIKTLDALAAGAVDVLDKPRPGESAEEWEETFRRRLRRVARVRVITHLEGRRRKQTAEWPDQEPTPIPSRGIRIVALGASTGGPRALRQILSGVTDLPCVVLVVLHLGEPFSLALASWLQGLVPMPVSEVQGGERLDGLDGKILFAPPDHHVTVENGRLRLSRAPERHGLRPSVDVLFESLARHQDPSRVAAGLLTGMGRDGAAGLAALRRAGATTFVQDRETCTVFGMPSAALDLGAAEFTLGLAEIAAFLTEVCHDD